MLYGISGTGVSEFKKTRFEFVKRKLKIQEHIFWSPGV
jgi:hypothetical protein